MTIQTICKKLLLFLLFLILVLQISSATSWFFGLDDDSLAPAKTVCTPQNALPFGVTNEQLTASLAQFTTNGTVSRNDIAQFLASAERGARLAYHLFFVEQQTPYLFKHRKEHLHALVDLISFFYLVAMLNRDDGLMPADVTFGVVEHDDHFDAFVHQYLKRIEHKNLDLGSTNSIFGANPLAYFRNQSHGFDYSWGINLCGKKDQPWQPLLFTGRWTDEQRLSEVSGPLYHLLIGTDPHDAHKLYIKPEECGIYYWSEWFGHLKGYLKALGRRTVLINHFFDADDDPQFNKEHLPRAVLTTFKASIRAHVRRLGPAERKAIRRGIAGMYEHAIKNEWDDFVTYIDSRFSMAYARRGNEIIIARETVFWSLYFVTTDQDTKKMFDALVAVKRALTCCALSQARTCSIKNIRESIKKFCSAYATVLPKNTIKNRRLMSQLGRISTRLGRLCTMDETLLVNFIEQHHRQLLT